MKYEPNYFGILPSNIRYNKNLTPNAKLLYSELTALTSREGYCWASNKYFANLYNVAPNVVSTWISALIKENLITTKMVITETGSLRRIYLGGIKDFTNRGIKDFLKHNNTTINNKSIINNTYRDSEESLYDYLNKKPFLKKCIKDWNNIPFTQNITLSKKTKLIEKLNKYINQLLNGTFTSTRGVKTFDTEWFKKNRISIPFKKLNKKEILVTIKKTALYNKEGYFVGDNSKLPKDLPTLMYNPRTGKSLFLLAYYKIPKPFNTLQDPDPKTSSYFIKHMNGTFTKKDSNKLFNGIKSISRFVENIPKDSLERYKIKSEVGTTFRISREYMDWLNYQDWLKEINVSILNTENKVWKRFVKEKENQYDGYSLQ